MVTRRTKTVATPELKGRSDMEPVLHASSRRLGVVASVRATTITVALDAEAPHAVSVATGTPQAVPRVNGYVLIPGEGGALVGMITALTSRAVPPPRDESATVDLPFASRLMVVAPLGTLQRGLDDCGSRRLELRRGVVGLPSIGDMVVSPTPAESSAIIDSDAGPTRVHIGRSVSASGVEVHLDIDRLFGRHVAVLGNTGSGKSCTMTGLVRWAAEAVRWATGATVRGYRIVVFDPNGEYGRCFEGLGVETRVLRPEPFMTGGDEPLYVPAWLWNSTEWVAFARAGPGVQRPLLQQALRALREGEGTTSSPEESLGRRVRPVLRSLPAPETVTDLDVDYKKRMNLMQRLENLADDLRGHQEEVDQGITDAINSCVETVEAILQSRHYKTSRSEGYNAPSGMELQQLQGVLSNLVALLPEPILHMASEDAPLPFDVNELADQVAHEASETEGARFAHTLGFRLRTLLSHQRIRSIIATNAVTNAETWLRQLLGGSGTSRITIIDLSLIPTEIVHIIVSVMARVIFETLQRHRKLTGQQLPTVFVVDEAQTFIARRFPNLDPVYVSPADVCRSTFERVAREGRKFGLGLVLSSQRPSELSPTVLSQCNTFVLHRLVNERDQQLVTSMVPDTLSGVLTELPNLPTRVAIVMGWAVPVPMLVEMQELPLVHQPASQDPPYWEIWTGTQTSAIDLQSLLDEWTA